jgi:hypothetical protein
LHLLAQQAVNEIRREPVFQGFASGTLATALSSLATSRPDTQIRPVSLHAGSPVGFLPGRGRVPA